MEENDIKQQRSHKEKRGEKQKEEAREVPGIRKELGTHILGREVLSPQDVWPSDPMFLASIRSSRQLPNQSLPYQSPTFGPILYKLIVKGLLGLNSVRHWAWSENRDPTIIIINGIMIVIGDF